MSDISHPDTSTATKKGMRPPRFPIRWRWAMLVGAVALSAVLLLTIVTLDLERAAWLNNQDRQSIAEVNRLGETLKLPMLSGSQVEVDVLVRNVLDASPEMDGVLVHFADGKQQVFGDQGAADLLENFTFDAARAVEQAKRLNLDELWYARKVTYAGTSLGYVAVRYSETTWAELAGELWKRMLLSALAVILISGALVYWIAGKMSRPMEELAGAAELVANGNLNVRLLERGNDEITDAMHQFNIMVRELKHKEELRDSMGKYLNPKVVDKMFEGDSSSMQDHTQEVTVLFADMVSFTAFSEKLPAEKVLEILNQHFEVFNSIIHYFAGHVDKYIGDAVMAVFNHPNETPEHTRFAALTGLAMTQACQRLGVLRDDGGIIEFRVGLNRGEVIVGHIGSHERLEYTVIGDAVNVASRMGGLGAGSQVVVPYSTYEACQEGLEFVDMGEISVKGISQPVRVGQIVPTSDEVQQMIDSAINLAFDTTLPSAIRHQIEQAGSWNNHEDS